MSHKNILIVDDEKNIRRTLRLVLEAEGYTVLESENAEDALERLPSSEVDLILLDVRLPGLSGLDALKQLRSQSETQSLPVLMISGHASISEAVDAVRMGATDFLEKPLDRDRVLISVQNALRASELERELERLRADVHGRHEIIGQSPVILQLLSEIQKIAPTKARVLISGPSGTGKELIARAIHEFSTRRKKPFIKLNCAAIPSELIESELFGHERGAFSGANARKKGMFELAHGGTLFLDEIGDMSLSAQAKVLRALQNGEIARVGSEQTLIVDVRVLAATNKDLLSLISLGQFREDLYFRLNVVPIRSPALDERRADIPILAKNFAAEFCQEHGLRDKPMEQEVLDALQTRVWPGNVRELKNVVERLLILSADRITLQDFQRSVSGSDPEPSTNLLSSLPPSTVLLPSPSPTDTPMTLRQFRDYTERAYISQILQECDWNISRAAEILGTERTNLHKKIRALSIRKTN